MHKTCYDALPVIFRKTQMTYIEEPTMWFTLVANTNNTYCVSMLSCVRVSFFFEVMKKKSLWAP